MDRDRVADILEEIAFLLDLKGENPFKGRAYRRAAETIRGLERSLEALVADGSIRELPGIGPALAEAITTLATTGSLPYRDELRAAVPGAAAILDLTRVPGLGTKKARAIVEGLGIGSIGELEYACHENRLLELPGFGSRAQQKILEAIDTIKAYRGRFLLGDVLPAAEDLERDAAAWPGVAAAAIAGAVRRREAIVDHLVLVLSVPDPGSIDPARATSGRLEGPLRFEAGRLRGRLTGGPPLECRLAGPRHQGRILVEATGGLLHLEELRARAEGAGLRWDPAGLFRGDTPIETPDEPALYGHLGLPWIPPELRDHPGAVALAAEGRLPRLIEDRDIRGILHVHSSWSDGRLGIEEIVRRSSGLGYQYVGITDHSRSARYARGLSVEALRQQQLQIDAAQAGTPGIRVLKGSEVDILPDGSLDYPDEVLAGLDFVVASIHSAFGLKEADQTARVVRALRHPRTTILGHPTGRLLLAREPYAIDLDRVLQVAAEEGVAVELNAHPQRLDLDAEACRRARALGARVAIDPDAHDGAGLTDVRYGVANARRAGLEAADVLNTVPVERLATVLSRGR
jgi:DNA polymerase (family 10)